MLSFSLSKRNIARASHALLFLLALTASTALIATAFFVHLSGFSLIAAYGALAVAILATFVAVLISRARAWAVLLLTVAASTIWYQTIQPKADRVWAFDVAHTVQAHVNGQTVEMKNVRDFEWTSIDTANASWEARSFDLQKLASADLITSVWDNPDIAHVIVSFGFSDGQRIAFSVETRREEHEAFYVLGGFFRQFELVLIAATEEDILKLRTNHRHEDVKLFPLALSEEQLHDLFLAYVELANQLEEQPAFYNTLTHNCTTTLYPFVTAVAPELALDWRLLMSGHLPSYIDELGGFEGTISMELRNQQAAITQLALTDQDADYSKVIRQAYLPR